MLTVDMLRQNSALSGLTDEQLTAIATMSQNDENAVIGRRIGELHGQYDKDIFEITGLKKKDAEKSYDYNKRILNEYKAKIEAQKGLQSQLDAANGKIAELQGKIDAGNLDEEAKKQLNDYKQQVTQLQSKLAAETAKLQAKEAEMGKALQGAYIDFAFERATAGLKFKAGITEAIQKTLISAAKAEVLSKGTPDFVDDGNGGKKLVMRGADGNTLLNPKNNLNPYTIEELVRESSIKDVLDAAVRQTGGGTGDNGGKGGAGGSELDLSAAKTQVEADNIISKYLLSQGLTTDSQEYADKLIELRNEAEISKLPIR